MWCEVGCHSATLPCCTCPLYGPSSRRPALVIMSTRHASVRLKVEHWAARVNLRVSLTQEKHTSLSFNNDSFHPEF